MALPPVQGDPYAGWALPGMRPDPTSGDPNPVHGLGARRLL